MADRRRYKGQERRHGRLVPADDQRRRERSVRGAARCIADGIPTYLPRSMLDDVLRELQRKHELEESRLAIDSAVGRIRRVS